MPKPAGEAVSVVTPVRNGRSTLPALFESLGTQALDASDLRWIVVDDGSEDGTTAWLEQAAATAPFEIDIVRTHGGLGAGAARNRGLELVAAPWVVFADADDVFESGALAAWRNAAEHLEVDVLITDAKGAIPRSMIADLGLSARHLSPAEVWDGEVLRPWWVWGKLIRRELIERGSLRFGSAAEGQDLVFYVDCVLRASRIGYAPALPGYIYSGASRSALGAPLPDARSIFGAYRDVLRRLAESGVPVGVARRGASPILGGLAVNLIRGVQHSGRRGETADLQRQALEAFQELGFTIGSIRDVKRRDRFQCAVGWLCARLPVPFARLTAAAWVTTRALAHRARACLGRLPSRPPRTGQV